jgi:hypothetical protein
VTEAFHRDLEVSAELFHGKVFLGGPGLIAALAERGLLEVMDTRVHGGHDTEAEGEQKSESAHRRQQRGALL